MDMAASGWIRREKLDGRSISYVASDNLRAFFCPGPQRPAWVVWPAFVAAYDLLHQTLESLSESNAGSLLVDAELKRAGKSFSRLLAQSGFRAEHPLDAADFQAHALSLLQ